MFMYVSILHCSCLVVSTHYTAYWTNDILYRKSMEGVLSMAAYTANKLLQMGGLFFKVIWRMSKKNAHPTSSYVGLIFWFTIRGSLERLSFSKLERKWCFRETTFMGRLLIRPFALSLWRKFLLMGIKLLNSYFLDPSTFPLYKLTLADVSVCLCTLVEEVGLQLPNT